MYFIRIKKNEIIWETKTDIEKEKKTLYVQNILYKELWINSNIDNNPDSKKFTKWVVDGLILNNIKLIEEIISHWIEDLKNLLKNFLNPEIILEIVKELVSSLWDVINNFWNPYELWISVWWLWLWIIWKSLKWLKILDKIPEIKWSKAIDFEKIDILELKWTYSLNTIKWLKPVEAKRKMEEFSNAIDVKYLINHPERIDTMLDIIESMCDYIENNSTNILKLSPNELQDFRYVFGDFRKNIDNLWKNNLLSQFKDEFITLRWKMRKIMLVLNPNLLPKN